ncbi:hypothetical protein THAOC_34263, partial [Thalassiosira oceanica]
MDEDASASRKLSDDETSSLRSILLRQLSVMSSGPEAAQAEDDASDILDYVFTMVANGRKVGFVVKEVRQDPGETPNFWISRKPSPNTFPLPSNSDFAFRMSVQPIQLKSMDMDVCDASSADSVGRALSKFLRKLNGEGIASLQHQEQQQEKVTDTSDDSDLSAGIRRLHIASLQQQQQQQDNVATSDDSDLSAGIRRLHIAATQAAEAAAQAGQMQVPGQSSYTPPPSAEAEPPTRPVELHPQISEQNAGRFRLDLIDIGNIGTNIGAEGNIYLDSFTRHGGGVDRKQLRSMLQTVAKDAATDWRRGTIEQKDALVDAILGSPRATDETCEGDGSDESVGGETVMEDDEPTAKDLIHAAKGGDEGSLTSVKNMVLSGTATVEQYCEALAGHQVAVEELENPRQEEHAHSDDHGKRIVTKEREPKTSSDELKRINLRNDFTEVSRFSNDAKDAYSAGNYKSVVSLLDGPVGDLIEQKEIDRMMLFAYIESVVESGNTDKALLRRSLSALDRLANFERRQDTGNSIKPKTMAVAVELLQRLMPQLSSPEDSVLFLHCLGMLRKTVADIKHSGEASRLGVDCDFIENRASVLYNERASAFQSDQTDHYLRMLEGLNISNEVIRDSRSLISSERPESKLDEHALRLINLVRGTLSSISLQEQREPRPDDEIESYIQQVLEIRTHERSSSPRGVQLRPTQKQRLPRPGLQPKQNGQSGELLSVRAPKEGIAGVSMTDKVPVCLDANDESHTLSLDRFHAMIGKSEGDLNVITVSLLAANTVVTLMEGKVPLLIAFGKNPKTLFKDLSTSSITPFGVVPRDGCLHPQALMMKKYLHCQYTIDELRTIGYTLQTVYAWIPDVICPFDFCDLVLQFAGGELSKDQIAALKEARSHSRHFDALLTHAVITMDTGDSDLALALLSDSDRRMVESVLALVKLSRDAARMGREGRFDEMNDFELKTYKAQQGRGAALAELNRNAARKGREERFDEMNDFELKTYKAQQGRGAAGGAALAELNRDAARKGREERFDEMSRAERNTHEAQHGRGAVGELNKLHRMAKSVDDVLDKEKDITIIFSEVKRLDKDVELGTKGQPHAHMFRKKIGLHMCAKNHFDGLVSIVKR